MNKNNSEDFDFLRLSDDFSVVQTALLIVEEDLQENIYIMHLEEHKRPKNFNKVFDALKKDIKLGKLKANIIYNAENAAYVKVDDPQKQYCETFYIKREKNPFSKLIEPPHIIVYETEPDWEKTTINKVDIQHWLSSKKRTSGFFFPYVQTPDLPLYLDKNNECYSPKLAAAVRAWEAVSSNPNLTSGKTVKKALEKWLAEHVEEFKLTNKDGTENKKGIEEIAKVANWNTQGGAPKTPT
jgi:hypothetical protein